MRCYVASPCGFTEAGRLWYGQVLLPALREVAEPVDPWALTSAEEVAEAARRGEQRAFWLEVGRRNAEALRSCEALVAVLDGQEPDSGTVAELGYAVALGLRCHGLRTDLRLAGEPGMRVNLQVEAFVELAGGRVRATVAEVMEDLRSSG